MIINWAAGGLDEVDIAATDGFLDLDIHFAVGKLLMDHGPEIHPQIPCHFISQDWIRGAGKEAEAIIG